MMKNRKLLYFLLPSVLVVWGIIVYKIYQVVTYSDSRPIVMVKNVLLEKEMEQENYALLLNYKDPFIKKLRESKHTPSTTFKQVAVKRSSLPQIEAIDPVVVAQWEAITYSGMIENDIASKRVALIVVKGKSYMVKAGEIVDEFEVKKIFKDSVVIRGANEEIRSIIRL